MTLISPQRVAHRSALNVRVDARLLATLKAYARCISSSQEYVVHGALLKMFVADRDFRHWLQDREPTVADALRDLLDGCGMRRQ